MKLNIDCVRDILLYIEGRPVNSSTTLSVLVDALPNYSEEDVYYCCIKLNEADFLDVMTVPITLSHGPGIKSIHDLTFYGHEFLENIRTEDNWNKIKQTAGKVGSFSLQAITSIATELISTNLARLL